MEDEIHNTHLLSNSSEDDKNNIEKTLLFSKISEIENPENNSKNKIDIKDLFKDLTEREKNKLIYLDGNEESNEGENKESDEATNYYRNINKKKDKRKNITQNLKGWLEKKKKIKQINIENFELITVKNDNKNGENKNNENNEDNNINKTDENEKENEEEEKDELIDNIIGNSANKNNDRNNKDIPISNRENRITEELKNNAQNDSREGERNEGNKENNLNQNNENNENSFNNYLNNEEIDNSEIMNKNIIEDNIFGKGLLSNKNQNEKYDKSNLNFYDIEGDRFGKNSLIPKPEREKEEYEQSEEDRRIKHLNEQNTESEDNFNFNSSEISYSFEEEELLENKKEKKNNKINNITKNKERKNKVYNNTNKKSLEKEKGKNRQLKKSSIEAKDRKAKTNTRSKNKNSNKKGNSLFNFVSPKNKTKKLIKKEINLPIQRKCYFSKTIIEMDSDQFILLNKQIEISEEKNKISQHHHHKRNDYNPYLKKNYMFDENDLKDRFINKKFFDLDNGDNDNKNYLTYLDISKPNDNRNSLMNQGHIFNHTKKKNRRDSPNILLNRYIIKNLQKKNNYRKKLTDIPLSPYLLSKYNNMNKPLNKSNSAINLFNNRGKKQINYKFPSITNNLNSLKSMHTNIHIPNTPNENNLNIFKTNDVFNSNSKNMSFIPILQKRPLKGLKSANTNKFQNYNAIDIETSSPFHANSLHKLKLDIKNLQNAKKFHFDDKGYERHFGNEKDCPVCQSVLMKSNYNMKNFHNYQNFIKQRDKSEIEKNKKQFLCELKIPNSKSHRMEAAIIREIRQFINNSKKNETNNKINDASIINAYFEV